MFILFALLRYNRLYGFLLLFQRCDHLLLLCLLAFKVASFALSLVQKGALVLLCGSQFGMFLGDFGLFALDHFALCALVVGIFAHKTQATEHLGKVFSTENEHQLVLNGTVVVHIAHGLDKLVLAVVKLRLQHIQLVVQLSDVAVEAVYVVADCVYGAAFVGYLGIDDHQVLQTLLHVALIGAQFRFLFFDVALYLLALVLQTLYRSVATGGVSLLRCRFCAFFRCG